MTDTHPDHIAELVEGRIVAVLAGSHSLQGPGAVDEPADVTDVSHWSHVTALDVGSTTADGVVEVFH